MSCTWFAVGPADRRAYCAALVVVVALVVPVLASAQNGGSISGVVSDVSGAVLPGVSVEVSGPALIEKVRSVTTDTQGQYRIIDLPPGTYAVTFLLSGFSTVRREGIAISTGFTGTVHAQLTIGAIEETLTVSGASPVVDVQQVTQQTVFSAETVKLIPTGRTVSGFTQLVPGLNLTESGSGVITDAGGLLGDGARMTVHGSRNNDLHRLVNGSPTNGTDDTGYGPVTSDVGGAEEVMVNVAANPAEYQRGGVVMNLVPREGGNRFNGAFFLGGANSSMQSNNLTDDLEARGLLGANRLSNAIDISASVGGPIKQDKIWFYLSARRWSFENLIAGVFHDSVIGDAAYTPDLSKQARDFNKTFNQSLRMTWQATPRNKFGLFVANQPRTALGTPAFGLTAVESLLRQQMVRNQWGQVSWTAPMTDRLLVEAAMSIFRNVNRKPAEPGVTPETYSITDTATGFTYGSAPLNSHKWEGSESYRFSVSYVTGSHALKVGVTQERGDQQRLYFINNDMNLRFTNMVPNRITLHTTPRRTDIQYNAMLGVFVQDQWRIKNLTISPGLRFDYHNSSVPAQDVPATRFLAARHFDEVKNVPNWRDLSPRLAVAYDPFGNGKTAVKASIGRYLNSELTSIAAAANPIQAVTNTTNRTWSDGNQNFIPECDFLNPLANAECGPSSDLNFGKPNITTRYDPAYLDGFGARGANWEVSAGVQHELLSQVAVTANYFRRWYTGFTVTDNRKVGPEDFDTYCITAPSDPRLPKGGGYQLCGLTDVKPAKFGQSENFVTGASAFGQQREIYDGVDVNVNARPSAGMRLGGGFSTGRTRTERCFVIDSQQDLFQCDVRPPFQTQIKLHGSYALPWDSEIGAAFQSYPGTMITASATIPNAQIAPSLGRNLSAGANGTATVSLVEPGTMYGDRLTQLDLRLSKNFTFGRTRLKGMADLFNAFNDNTVIRMNTSYGPNWLQPTLIANGRLLRLSVQLDF